jgi:radical SAM protein with 4Fe4S-binding SPASM domain
MKINKGQFVLSRWKLFRFSWFRAKGHVLSFLRNRFRWHVYPRLRKVSSFPDHVDLELASTCQMKCPMCYTINDQYKQSVPKTMMKRELFMKLVDECARHGVYSIRLSLRGEPFLHRDIVELIAYAKRKGIKEISTLTNGLALDPARFVAIMEAGLDWLTISFDGMGETYNRIRYPATFDQAVAKIRQYHQIKKARGSTKPVIKVQAVWPSIQDNPKGFYDLFNPIVDNIASNPLIDFHHENQDVQYEENFCCPVLYQRLVVGSDGSVLLCSNDEYGRYKIGNANEESLYAIWRGPRMRHARELHQQRIGYKTLAPCKDCYLPRKTRLVAVKLGDKTLKVEKYIGNPETISSRM